MTPTTVRVDSRVKRELDRFHGLVEMETGERLSNSELLRRLVQFASQRTEEFFEPAVADEPGFTRKDLEAHLARIKSWSDWNVESDASKIDQVLYEEGTPHSATLSEAEYLEKLKRERGEKR